ncbi:Phospholysine phosphohistidine inorganic pyrophosphate phosphatase [Armadillidium nasatum]|uniref:Phospholysine phosphohistidine inorganic pyrophosphate phosphatase n=1 Tax=Armadillidium nasatum TaxID=96803 RepID=A0A5N5TLS0_9CRUS|nr:Phospholysine phosphohistidine inorganic pyrophosphate phosphatase [Armadillidium nasatum]
MKIKGVLIDITGVLYESGEGFGHVIEKSVEAIQRLQSSGVPFRLLTNESSTSKEVLLKKLHYHGYNFNGEDIFSPIPAVKSIIKSSNLRPYVLVHNDVVSEFDEFDNSDPTCLVLGDADSEFSFQNMNKAFNVLLSMKKPILFSLGKGYYIWKIGICLLNELFYDSRKYYRHNNKLVLDVGAFTAALEYACDIKATVIGKPSAQYFEVALNDLNVSPNEAVMIGDDINSDIGGAQKCGLKGILVKTGKFTPEILESSSVTPDFVADNLWHAVDYLLSNDN